jgi:hypothetical protein
MYNIKKIWNDHGFEIVVVGSLCAILILALCRIGKKGTWSTGYSYTPGKTITKRSKRHIKVSSGEAECRRVLIKLFKKPFANCRPEFLRNPVTGGRFNLELDCYDPSLKLAVEYNGAQHYKYIPYFHKNKEAFYNQKYRDDMKRRMCRDNNISLIEVPNTVKVHDIERFLVKKLKRLGYLR